MPFPKRQFVYIRFESLSTTFGSFIPKNSFNENSFNKNAILSNFTPQEKLGIDNKVKQLNYSLLVIFASTWSMHLYCILEFPLYFLSELDHTPISGPPDDFDHSLVIQFSQKLPPRTICHYTSTHLDSIRDFPPFHGNSIALPLFKRIVPTLNKMFKQSFTESAYLCQLLDYRIFSF